MSATLMIDILLSTFNGERFLAEQLDSILCQSYSSFRVLIRDDGSTDNTLTIIEKYANADKRVSLVTDGSENLGAPASFLSLVARSDAEYFMLADQDDVWQSDKISKCYKKLVEMEAEFGTKRPLLIFTDLTVVNVDLTVLDGSLWHFQRLDPEICRDWKRLLAQNVVTGSTIIANAAARVSVLPFALPEMMHDHWIAVNVAKKGVVDYLVESTVLYRQHASNVEGARRAASKYFLGKASGLVSRLPFYRRAARHFGDVTAAELAGLKISLNLKRLAGKAE